MLDSLLDWLAQPKVAWGVCAIIAAWHALRMSYCNFRFDEMKADKQSEIDRLERELRIERIELSSVKKEIQKISDQIGPVKPVDAYGDKADFPKPKPKKVKKKKQKPKPKKAEDRWDELLQGE
jgi:hypothetical protein